MDRSPWIGEADRSLTRSAHTPCAHPRDERRQLPPQAKPPQTNFIRRTLDPTHQNAPQGRRAASATLQRPFYPAIPQQPRCYLLAYFYSATLAWYCSALDMSHPSTILLGADATETRFKSLSRESTDVIHLALHGYADLEYPDRSALIFAPESSGPDDGLLQVREIRNLHLKSGA